MGNKSDTVYEYKKVKPIEKGEDWNPNPSTLLQVTENTRTIKNKINELCIEQNHLMKDFELYKKAFKQFVTEQREKTIGTTSGNILFNSAPGITYQYEFCNHDHTGSVCMKCGHDFRSPSLVQ